SEFFQLFVRLLQLDLAKGKIVAGVVVDALGAARHLRAGVRVAGGIGKLAAGHIAAPAAAAPTAAGIPAATAAASAIPAGATAAVAGTAVVASAAAAAPVAASAVPAGTAAAPAVVPVRQVAGVGVGGVDHHAAVGAFALALAAHAVDGGNGGVDQMALVGVHRLHLVVAAGALDTLGNAARQGGQVVLPLAAVAGHVQAQLDVAALHAVDDQAGQVAQALHRLAAA